jgi:hypothetical protein
MELILQACKTKFLADKQIALAELSILLQSPVGIADHTSIVKEVENKINLIAQAEESLTVIEQIVSQNQPQQTETEK